MPTHWSPDTEQLRNTLPRSTQATVPTSQNNRNYYQALLGDNSSTSTGNTSERSSRTVGFAVMDNQVDEASTRDEAEVVPDPGVDPSA